MKMKALYAGAMTAVVACALTAAGVTLNTQWQDVPDDTTVGAVLDLRDAVTAPEATNIAAGVVARDVAPWALAGQARPVADLTAATNYTDAATNALAAETSAALGVIPAFSTNLVDELVAVRKDFGDWKVDDGDWNWVVLSANYHHPGEWNFIIQITVEGVEYPQSFTAYGPYNSTFFYFDIGGRLAKIYRSAPSNRYGLATTNDITDTAITLTNYADLATAVLSNATWTALGEIPIATTNIIDSRAVTWIDAGGRMIVGNYGFGGSVYFSDIAHFYGLDSIEINESGRTAGLGVRIDEAATNAATAVFAASADYALTDLTAATLILRSGEIGNYAAPTNFTLALDFADNGRSGDCILYAENGNPWDSAVAVTPQSLTLVSADLAKALTLGNATTNILTFTRVKANTVLVSKQEVK